MVISQTRERRMLDCIPQTCPCCFPTQNSPCPFIRLLVDRQGPGQKTTVPLNSFCHIRKCWQSSISSWAERIKDEELGKQFSLAWSLWFFQRSSSLLSYLIRASWVHSPLRMTLSSFAVFYVPVHHVYLCTGSWPGRVSLARVPSGPCIVLVSRIAVHSYFQNRQDLLKTFRENSEWKTIQKTAFQHVSLEWCS